jgi:hypothetical protein
VLPKVQVFLPPEEMPLLYLSETRTASIEDCIHFFPSLFRLSKSVIVSEPVSTATLPGIENSGLDATQDLSFRAPGQNAELMAKLKDLNDSQQDYRSEITGGMDEDSSRKNYNMKSQVSQKLKSLIKKREQLKRGGGVSSQLALGAEANEWIRKA